MLLCIYTSSTLILTILLILNHRSSYDELVQNHKPTYVAGGASQNAARGAAVCIVSYSPLSLLYMRMYADSNLAYVLYSICSLPTLWSTLAVLVMTSSQIS